MELLRFHLEENSSHDVNRSQDHLGLQTEVRLPAQGFQASTHSSAHPGRGEGHEEPPEQSWAETRSTEYIHIRRHHCGPSEESESAAPAGSENGGGTTSPSPALRTGSPQPAQHRGTGPLLPSPAWEDGTTSAHTALEDGTTSPHTAPHPTQHWGSDHLTQPSTRGQGPPHPAQPWRMGTTSKAHTASGGWDHFTCFSPGDGTTSPPTQHLTPHSPLGGRDHLTPHSPRGRDRLAQRSPGGRDRLTQRSSWGSGPPPSAALGVRTASPSAALGAGITRPAGPGAAPHLGAMQTPRS